LSPWVIFGITSIVVVTVVIILTLIEKIIDRKIRRKNEEEENFFREKIDYLKSEENKPDQFLVDLNQIVMEVFREALGLPNDTNYEEAIRLFNERGNIRAAKFANKIQTLLYSGERIDNSKLDSLLGELISLINGFMEVEKEKKSGEETSGFGTYVDKFLDRTNSMREEYGKIEKVKGSAEKEIIDLRREVAREQENIERKVPETLEKTALGEEEIRRLPPLPKQFKKEETEPWRVTLPKNLKEYSKIGSLDDLARIKEKIEVKKKSLGVN